MNSKNYIFLILMGIIFAFLPNALSAATDIPMYLSVHVADEYETDGYYNCVLIELIERVAIDGKVYRPIRVQSDYTGTMTYYVPIEVQDLIEIVMLEQSIVQPFGEGNPFNVTQIMDSGLPHEDSIVIVLLSDGFEEDDEYVFLHHANTAITDMLGTHPFGLFKELVTVYAIHTHGENPQGLHFICECPNNCGCDDGCWCFWIVQGYLGSIRVYDNARGGTTTTGTGLLRNIPRRYG